MTNLKIHTCTFHVHENEDKIHEMRKPSNSHSNNKHKNQFLLVTLYWDFKQK